MRKQTKECVHVLHMSVCTRSITLFTLILLVQERTFLCFCANGGSSIVMHGCTDYMWRFLSLCVCVSLSFCVCMHACFCEACCWPSKQTGVRSYQCIAPVTRWKPVGGKVNHRATEANKTARLSLALPKYGHTCTHIHTLR